MTISAIVTVLTHRHGRDGPSQSHSNKNGGDAFESVGDDERQDGRAQGRDETDMGRQHEVGRADGVTDEHDDDSAGNVASQRAGPR